MKAYLIIAAALLAVLNALLLLPATRPYAASIAVLALLLALLVLALSFFAGTPARTTTTATTTTAAPGPAPAPAPVPAPPPPQRPPPPAAAPANQAEAEVALLFSLLQEKGRLVDFLMEDITGYDESQVAAAARVVHQGCRQVLQEHLKISPIAEAGEGSQVTVPAGYAADEYRIVGKLSGQPPFTGTLVHKGWKTEWVKLPRLVRTDEKRLPAIAPAEVELA
ncbi:MAG: DUF2760 domain-containing protein [Verrucomicrobia bacterium]|nr:DUF2760 domain-containing protein [Verrucomicrobiota bacterium]